MSAAKSLADAVQRLRAAGVDDPARDARVLLAHALGVERSRLTLVIPDPILPDAALDFERMISQRIARQPVAQIIGHREFYGHVFAVTPDVLDPRPDTERLIELALEVPFETVLDLGSGTGCILLTMLDENKSATGIGVDVSDTAIAVANKNRAALGLIDRAEFIASDWFENVSGRFDLIVSNPPYITADEMKGLAPEVRDWEPELALSPGGDGLDAYRIISKHCRDYLNPRGHVFLEIGPDQGAAVTDLMTRAGFVYCEVFQDLDGRDRVVKASLKS